MSQFPEARKQPRQKKGQRKHARRSLNKKERKEMNLEEWYFQTPIVTRCYLTMSFLITAGCALEVSANTFSSSSSSSSSFDFFFFFFFSK